MHYSQSDNADTNVDNEFDGLSVWLIGLAELQEDPLHLIETQDSLIFEP